jgi:hypothetical protein
MQTVKENEVVRKQKQPLRNKYGDSFANSGPSSYNADLIFDSITIDLITDSILLYVHGKLVLPGFDELQLLQVLNLSVLRVFNALQVDLVADVYINGLANSLMNLNFYSSTD